jgi:hypothetical protein
VHAASTTCRQQQRIAQPRRGAVLQGSRGHRQAADHGALGAASAHETFASLDLQGARYERVWCSGSTIADRNNEDDEANYDET